MSVFRDGSISKTVMKDVMSDQAGDLENTQIFPSEGNWLGFRRRLSFPFGQGTMPASGPQTVYSITHSDHSIMQNGSGAITVFEMHTSETCFLKSVGSMNIMSNLELVKSGQGQLYCDL